ncbi:MAG: beta-ketoacyl-ACP synthase III [Candidatus Neomarinimicrobiota bacterium]|nr:beta-ketoacyl-ACP synthase III [Candidatus Neomarinimicrobiota bacterium]
MRATITATAHHVPEKILTNYDIEKMVQTSDEWIQNRTGIKQRHIASDDEASSDLSTHVANKLLKKRGIKPEKIDIIIVGTVTPDHLTPSTAAIVQNNINAQNAWAFDLSAACSGFLFGLETGSKLIESGKYKTVMVIGVDTMTSILDFKNRETCIIFGDGAGGVILEPSKSDNGIISSILKTDGSGASSLNVLAGGSRKPATEETIANREHFIRQDGKKVFKFAVKRMTEVSKEVLLKNGLSGNDIKLFIPHQANKRIIDATGERCGIPKDRVLINIDRYGNTTAGTIPIALNEAVENKLINNGDYILLSAFGSGFTWGSILIKWDSRI